MKHLNELLAGQKRQKRPRSGPFPLQKLRSLTLFFVQKPGGILVFFTILLLFSSKNLSLLTSDLIASDKTMTILDAMGKPLSDENMISAIHKHASAYLRSGNTEELSKLASASLSGSTYSGIIIHKESLSSYKIILKSSPPEFSISADRSRIVSSDGSVYGSALGKGLPELRGIFSDRETGFEKKFINFINLKTVERKRILDALKLKKELEAANFRLRNMVFKKYRGYFATLYPSDTLVSFGTAPFAVKIERMRKIIQDLSSRGRYASRIELDYSGKAFVKEKLY